MNQKTTQKIIDKELAIKVIMDCKTRAVHKFQTILGFKQNMLTQYSVLFQDYLDFHHYKLAIEIDENCHSNRNIDYETKR